MATIDGNGESVTKAVTNDANLTPRSLLFDPVTNRLLVTIVGGGTVGGVAPTRLGVDANGSQITELVTNDANASIRPMAMTTEGYVLIDIA